jgi:uncharacterized membrane protein|tara:strand:- start:242 stop:628 length:387 start_codon:yes stop_codon:yes gene_type:complete
MVKHKRWSDKPKSESLENDIDFKKKQEIVSETPSRGIKSIVVSGIKYIYIVAAAALFSGIFTPLTLGVDVEEVFSGILTVLLGLAGGVIIYLGTKNQKYSIIMVCGGLGMIITSLILIHELAKRSLFG